MGAIQQMLLGTAPAAAGGGITFVNAATGGGAATSSISMTMPSGAQVGDSVVVFLLTASEAWSLGTQPGTPSVSTSGYTQQATASSGGAVEIRVFTKYLTSLDATIQATRTGAVGDPYIAIAQIWRGVSQSTPMDATPTLAAGNAPTPAAITPVTAGARVLTYMGFAGSDFTITPPAGTLNVSSNSAAYTNADTLAQEVAKHGVANVAWGGSGAQTFGSWNLGTGTVAGQGVTLALRPG